MKLISSYIRNQIAAKLGPHTLDATLTKYTTGTRTPGAQAGGTNPTSTTYAAKGFVRSFESTQIDGTLVKTEDRDISLLGGTIEGDAVPEPGDKITIEDPPDSGTTVTFRIVGGGKDGLGVRRDSVGAVYRCHCRR